MKTLMSFCVVVFMMAVALMGFLYAIIAEVDLRELKRDRMAYNQILADKALAERAVDRDLSIASRLPSSWSR